VRIEVEQGLSGGLLCWDDAGQPFTPPLPRARVTNRETGEVLDVIKADDVTGEAEVFRVDAFGELVVLFDGGMRVAREVIRAPLRIEFHGG
jgi:hypothetical protein